MKKIGYQGMPGAYSEAAIIKEFAKEAQPVGFDSFEEVFEAIIKEKVDLGVLPFENTIAGSVAVNYDQLLKHDVEIIGEIYLKIRHALMSHKGNSIENIKRAYSHPHALEQCRDFLKDNNIKAVAKYDTAGSAKFTAENKNQEEAAIASELSAEIYNLDILKKDIQSEKENITKFFIISKKGNEKKSLKKEKTSIVFKTKHYPGALVNTLQRLAKNDINLTKLESRPIPQNPWEYVFYADFEGGTDDENIKFTLNEMEATSIFVKILGSYPLGKKPE